MEIISKPGYVSASVGTSGNCASRLRPPTAIGFTFPAAVN